MEKIRVEEISRIIGERIENFDNAAELEETGTVLTIGDGIARVYGLTGVMAGELVEFAGGGKGVTLNLEEDNVGVSVLGSTKDIHEGDSVKRLRAINSVPLGEKLLGRVVDALGQPIDGAGDCGAAAGLIPPRRTASPTPGCVAISLHSDCTLYLTPTIVRLD